MAPRLGREQPISAHISYLRHVDEETLRTKDGMLLTIIKVDGLSPDRRSTDHRCRGDGAQYLGSSTRR
ncbi:hypothetical protein ACOJBM_02230 [Rhizobium beringeri]